MYAIRSYYVIRLIELLIQGGCIDNWLESRAGLPPGLECPVKLAVSKVAAAHDDFYKSGFSLNAQQGSYNFV